MIDNDYPEYPIRNPSWYPYGSPQPSEKDLIVQRTVEEITNLRKELKEVEDEINRPKHYNFGKFETIDVLETWFPDEPLLWQVGKYISRWNRKDTPLKNLKKALFYLNRKIQQLEKEQQADATITNK